jgi:O-antigen ligase
MKVKTMPAPLKEPVLTLANCTLFIATLLPVFILGVGSAIAPIYIAIFSMIPIFVILACWKFRIAILVMLLFASGLIPNSFTPTIPFLSGRMRTEDLFLVMLLIIGVFRLMTKIDKIKGHPLWRPLCFFSVLVLISLVIAFTYKNKPRIIMAEFRVVLYWSYAILLVVSIKHEENLRTAINFIIGLSTAIALAVVIQSFSGIQLLNYSRLEVLHTVTDVDYGINRSTFGGMQGFAVFSFALVLARLAKGEMRPILAVPVLMAIMLALSVSFGRGVWAMTFLVVFIASAWLGLKCFVRIWVVLISVAAVVASASFVMKPALLDAVVSRATSVGDELKVGGSWDYRMYETGYAIKTIKKHPIRGIGLGGEYLPLSQDMHEDAAAMAHNSYLYIALKFGLLGLLFPAWLCVAVLLKARQIGDTLSIAIGSAFLNPVVVGYTQMEWANMYGVLFMATMVGLLIAHDNISLYAPAPIAHAPAQAPTHPLPSHAKQQDAPNSEEHSPAPPRYCATNVHARSGGWGSRQSGAETRPHSM